VQLGLAERPPSPVRTLEALVDRLAEEVPDEQAQPQAAQGQPVVGHAAGQLERAAQVLHHIGPEHPPLEPRVVRPLLDVRRGQHPRRERLADGRGHPRREHVHDVDGPVLETELDQGEPWRPGLPVGQLCIEPDAGLPLGDRRERPEAGGRLVEAVVEADRGDTHAVPIIRPAPASVGPFGRYLEDSARAARISSRSGTGAP
jgi:hypothetical protein